MAKSKLKISTISACSGRMFLKTILTLSNTIFLSFQTQKKSSKLFTGEKLFIERRSRPTSLTWAVTYLRGSPRYACNETISPRHGGNLSFFQISQIECHNKKSSTFLQKNCIQTIIAVRNNEQSARKRRAGSN